DVLRKRRLVEQRLGLREHRVVRRARGRIQHGADERREQSLDRGELVGGGHAGVLREQRRDVGEDLGVADGGHRRSVPRRRGVLGGGSGRKNQGRGRGGRQRGDGPAGSANQ